MSGTANPNTLETDADMEDGDAGLWRFWQGQEAIAEKEERSWQIKGRKIIKRYRDERPEGDRGHRMNIFWSNVQVLQPTLYARTPKPDVQRRYKDQDDVGRLASTLLERCLSYSLDNTGFDIAMRAAVLDRLLPGRGVVRVMYIPTYGDVIEEEGETDAGEIEPPVEEDNDIAAAVTARLNGPQNDGPQDATDAKDPLREVTYEEVKCVYVFWEDYREAPARAGDVVAWKRYRSYMTRAELIERFGAAKGKKVELDFTPRGLEGKEGSAPPDMFKKATVYEYWDQSKRRVVWLSPGTPDIILDEMEDPLDLPGFYPSPTPLLATTTTDKRIPVPDYHQYQDQALELDNLTARIDILVSAMKLAGVYAGSSKNELSRLLEPGVDNILIPVNDWAAFTDKGGLQNMIAWMPLKEVAETIIQLYDARDRCKQILYEITGLGDIMRGQTDPNETASAQKLKSAFSTRRISPKQKEVAEMCRDTIRLMAAVVSGQFSAQTVSKITGYPQLKPVPPLPPMPPQMIPGPPPGMGGPPPGGPPPGPPQMGAPQ